MKVVLWLQGDDPGYLWAITVLWFWAQLVIGVVGACLTICWLLQVTSQYNQQLPFSKQIESAYTTHLLTKPAANS